MISWDLCRKSRFKLGEMTSCHGSLDPGPTSQDSIESNSRTRASSSSSNEGFPISAANDADMLLNQAQKYLTFPSLCILASYFGFAISSRLLSSFGTPPRLSISCCSASRPAWVSSAGYFLTTLAHPPLQRLKISTPETPSGKHQKVTPWTCQYYHTHASATARFGGDSGKSRGIARAKKKRPRLVCTRNAARVWKSFGKDQADNDLTQAQSMSESCLSLREKSVTGSFLTTSKSER
jgi:hypothetical protein